jgi:hypothetical protein
MELLVHSLHKVEGLTIFVNAQGLSTQCDEVVAKVNEFIARGYKVNIRCIGLSRGGTRREVLNAKVIFRNGRFDVDTEVGFLSEVKRYNGLFTF